MPAQHALAVMAQLVVKIHAANLASLASPP
jgi:hypothetical protein